MSGLYDDLDELAMSLVTVAMTPAGVQRLRELLGEPDPERDDDATTSLHVTLTQAQISLELRMSDDCVRCGRRIRHDLAHGWRHFGDDHHWWRGCRAASFNPTTDKYDETIPKSWSAQGRKNI